MPQFEINHVIQLNQTRYIHRINVDHLGNIPEACIAKGQLISECLFEKYVWTKIPTKNLIDSAHYTCWAESIKFFVGILVQTIFSKRHSEIN